MAKIGSQITELRKKIIIPYKIIYVDRVIKKSEFEKKCIYIHITI